MKRKWLYCVILFVMCLMSSNAGQLSRSSVDAVTAATVNNKCKFNQPVQAADTSATITWTEGETGGTASFCYGTTNPPAPCRAVTAMERSAKAILVSGLKPSTQYYIYIEMTKSGETPYAASGSFSTTAKASIISPVRPPSQSLISLTGNRLTLGTGVQPGDRIVVTDLSGRIMVERTDAGRSAGFDLPRNARGVYFVRLVRGNVALATVTFVNFR
jgi:hypothetical protein